MAAATGSLTTMGTCTPSAGKIRSSAVAQSRRDQYVCTGGTENFTLSDDGHLSVSPVGWNREREQDVIGKHIGQCFLAFNLGPCLVLKRLEGMSEYMDDRPTLAFCCLPELLAQRNGRA